MLIEDGVLGGFVPGLFGDFVASTGGGAFPAHDLVERFEVGARFAVREELGGLERGDFFGNGGGDELVDAGPFLAADARDGLF